MIMVMLLALHLFVASIMDILWRKVKNSWIVFGLISGLMLSFLDAGICGDGGCHLEMSSNGLIPALAGVAFASGSVILYLLRLLGAADVKLLMVSGSFLGLNGLKDVLLPMLFAAGVFALFFIKEKRFPAAPGMCLGVVAYLAVTM